MRPAGGSVQVPRWARGAAVAVAVLALGGAGLAACSDDDSSSTTTTTEAEGSQVIGPVVLSASETEATVAVGRVVTFDMGEPGDGRFLAVSSDPAVFRIDGEGRTEGTSTSNAGGTALAAGTAEVTVTAEGTPDGPAEPVTFTITVE